MQEGTAMLAVADATAIPMADKSVDLVFTSPPYLTARTYGIGAQRGLEDWVAWMMQVVRECCRVSRGLVLVNCAGVTKNWRYQPGPEILLADWWRAGGECWRPAYWHRVGIPGSGGKQWLRADVEYVLAFKGAAGKIPWADNTACGHVPKWGPGGEMSSRAANGARANQSKAGAVWGGGGTSFGRRSNGLAIAPAGKNQWGHSYNSGGTGGSIDNPTCQKPRPSHFNVTRRDGSGARDDASYAVPVKANPGNLVKVIVGGGVMGSKLAHENEAPFPEKLAEFFVKSFCPPGGTVLDPFSGSATTAAVAKRLGRIGIGFDIRMSQAQLGTRRIAEPPKPAKRPKRAKAQAVGQGNLFAA